MYQTIKRQIQALLNIGLIRPSKATSYSQILLVPKPDGKWRFCIDYRLLNSCIKGSSWPLPHIQNMLQRIGQKRPCRFASFDMTQGYFQGLISESSKEMTAFISYLGIYEWNRIPMGIKPAGPHFHKAIALDVLQELLYVICELYIDDLLCYATSDDELLSRLRLLFERFRAKQITCNPDKCRLGMSEIEWVGHHIDAKGISFSREKLDGIQAFPLPSTQKQLKSFIGLANYFRDHVLNHSTLIHPLQKLVDGYTTQSSRYSISWTPDTIECFEQTKKAISSCTKLFFLDPDTLKNPVGLEIDASDYGIGAYLWQIVNNNKFPIMLISKSLNKTQLRWSTPEKECYAIVFALTKMAHLLSDIEFIIYTDHENLTRLYDTGSSKVLRWKLLIQEFNATIVHKPGVENMIADALSRLCPISDKNEYLTTIQEDDIAVIPKDNAPEIITSLEDRKSVV